MHAPCLCRCRSDPNLVSTLPKLQHIPQSSGTHAGEGTPELLNWPMPPSQHTSPKFYPTLKHWRQLFLHQRDPCRNLPMNCGQKKSGVKNKLQIITWPGQQFVAVGWLASSSYLMLPTLSDEGGFFNCCGGPCAWRVLTLMSYVGQIHDAKLLQWKRRT